MPRRRCPSNLTDAQWAVLEPLVPAPKLGGGLIRHVRRNIVAALPYVLRCERGFGYAPAAILRQVRPSWTARAPRPR